MQSNDMKVIPFAEYTVSNRPARSITEALAELDRELTVRRRIYDDWQKKGKLTWMDAHDRLERLLTAVKLLLEYDKQLSAAEAQNNNTAFTDTSLLSPDQLDRASELEPA